MAKPKIGYDNILEAGVVTTTSDATGFDKENAFDWNTYDGWKADAAGIVYYTIDAGSAVTCDYWAMAAHLLSENSATVQLQYSNDNFAADINDIGSLGSPSDNSPMFFSFAATSSRYWRFKITSTGSASFIGVICLGGAFEFVRAVTNGFQIPNDSHDDEILNSMSEGGNFLGRSIISQGISSPINITMQTIAWTRGDWRNFIVHAKVKPFFFVWDPDYSADVVYCWMIGKPTAPKIVNHKLTNVGIKVKGIA